ncbi:MAG: family 2 glycosyl transferase [Acidobacteria bacterium]|nr:MAG: family 2 glycosyl transferase [Acidobacteriota bacterium]
MISVITCTHNPRPDYLAETVEALARQRLPFDRWEYLLIDNASSPERTPKVDLSWHPQARMIREETLGLTPARLRGIREAQGGLLVFVDDDNVLDPNFLEEAMKVADQKPFLGSWSGQCRACFDEPPPEWTRRYWGNLVIREFDSDVWSNMPRLPQTMPCGAGLCIRRVVAQRYLALHENGDRKRFQFDRTGDSLISGGDNDLAACACELGMGIGLISALKLTHLIPPERVTLDYLAKLAEGIYFSAVILDALYARDGRIERHRVTWRDRLRSALLRRPHRKIFAASLRGRKKALAWLASRDG